MKPIPTDSFIGSHYIGREEQEAALQVIRSKSLFRYDGLQLLHKTDKFEEAVKQFLKVDHVLACSSGAAALKICCVALDIGPGDEVIMSPFTFIASAAAVLSCGAIPVFVDIDESMNIDPKRIKNKITSRTKAVMAIHIQGVPCDMDSIVSIAQEYDLKIIEDCAQAFAAQYDKNMVGTIGDSAAFSLQANKIITCGEGGIFTCKSAQGFERARRYHDNGGMRINASYPVWDRPECSFGENYKITELQSAIALEQLKKIDTIIDRQRYLYKRLTQGLKGSRLKLRNTPERAKPVPVSLCFLFDEIESCADFIAYTSGDGLPIELYCDKTLTSFNTFINKKGWHSSNAPYSLEKEYQCECCFYTEELTQRTAWMSISPELNEEQIQYIENVLYSWNMR